MKDLSKYFKKMTETEFRVGIDDFLNLYSNKNIELTWTNRIINRIVQRLPQEISASPLGSMFSKPIYILKGNADLTYLNDYLFSESEIKSLQKFITEKIDTKNLEISYLSIQDLSDSKYKKYHSGKALAFIKIQKDKNPQVSLTRDPFYDQFSYSTLYTLSLSNNEYFLESYRTEQDWFWVNFVKSPALMNSAFPKKDIYERSYYRCDGIYGLFKLIETITK